MKLKLNDAIGSMDYHDLVQLHEDLRQGGHSLKGMVQNEIIRKEKEQGKFCQVCQAELDANSTTNFTLLLGPEGLRRKASFCALDCLKYFISTIEKRKEQLKKEAEE